MRLPNIFEGKGEMETHPSGTTIFEKGQSGEVMYIVQEGQVEIRVGDDVVETVGPDGVFGEMALIENKPRSATTIAKTDCRLVPITKKQFLFMVDETPMFALYVMRIMSERLRRHDGSD